MVKKNKVELYEVLANHLAQDGQAAIDPLEESALLSRRRVTATRSGREIVFSLDAAFVIFVVVLLLIGTAFFMGYRRGSVEARVEFIKGRSETVARASGDLRVVREEPDSLAGGVVLPGGRYTLRVLSLPRTQENLEKLRNRREALLAMPMIGNTKLDVWLFDKGQALSLAVGIFDSRDNEVLRVLKDNLLRETGAEFSGMSIENADDLGKPVN